MTMTSCKFITDTRLDAFEKSIETLENNYKDLTPDELENSLRLCEEQLDALNNRDVELTPNQKERISNLTGRYHRLLIKIELYTMTHDLFGDVLEYLKGILNLRF